MLSSIWIQIKTKKGFQGTTIFSNGEKKVQTCVGIRTRPNATQKNPRKNPMISALDCWSEEPLHHGVHTNVKLHFPRLRHAEPAEHVLTTLTRFLQRPFGFSYLWPNHVLGGELMKGRQDLRKTCVRSNTHQKALPRVKLGCSSAESTILSPFVLTRNWVPSLISNVPRPPCPHRSYPTSCQ